VEVRKVLLAMKFTCITVLIDKVIMFLNQFIAEFFLI
jgi:hypothetical protein